MRTEQIGPCTLYLGDCLDVLPTLDVGRAVLMTDPPYSSGGIFRGDRVAHIIAGIAVGGFQDHEQAIVGLADVARVLEGLDVRLAVLPAPRASLMTTYRLPSGISFIK